MISRTAERSMAGKVSGAGRKGLRLQPGLWIAVLLVFAAQLAVFFWLGNPPAPARLQPTAAPMIHLSGNNWEELLALEDPTLFVLPHRNNFSGAVWIKNATPPFEPANSVEPPEPLQLEPKELGAVFAAFMETNPPPPFQTQMGL
jgi:hypothetical protein